MKHSNLVLLFTISVPLFLSAAEPSAFGAGNLDNPEPYGLTSNEKVILQNKNKLQNVVVKSNNQANEVDSLRERIDGLQSIIENLSRKTHNNKVNLKNLEDKHSINMQSTGEYETRLSEVVQTNVINVEKTKNVVFDLSLIIESIKKDYVTKAEFNLLVDEVNKFKELIVKELEQNKPQDLANVNGGDLYDQAKANFDKKLYTQAIKEYELLIVKNYKPAYAHYMIAEMYYQRKNYANAITYYKKSTSIYDKASYMPNLMLHSAISMDNTGDANHAKVFYKAIIAKFPNSNEAKVAKKYLGL